MKSGLIANCTAIAALVTLTASCGGGNSSNAPAEEQENRKTLVRTETVRTGTVTVSEEFTGTIEPFVTNNISPNMGGRIYKLHVDVGDQVRKGQLLVEMDPATYLQSRVQLANLETDLVRYEKLYAEGGISKQQLDQMETQVNVSRVALENLEENTKLVSPVDGIVTERFFDPGDVYNGTTGAILTVVQLSRVKVLINVSESYFPMVKNGMPVNITLDVYPGETFEGRVSLIHPAVDANTRTFTAEITIPNGNLKLRPGMFCRAGLNFGTAERVLGQDVAVQKQIGSNERFAFVIENGVARRRVVTTGRITGNEIEVLSGLRAGEQVVVAGAQKLLDGMEVEISKQ